VDGESMHAGFSLGDWPMLRISKALSASQAQTYHAHEFTSPAQSYWSHGQEIPGEWQGRLAEQFGLSGAVGAEEIARLPEGQYPLTGDLLVQH
jgi:TrwC relaxase